MEVWGGWRDSNPRQPEPQSGVLPLNYTHHSSQNYNIRCADSADIQRSRRALLSAQKLG